MFSLQGQSSSQTPIGHPSQTWKSWKLDHPAFKRQFESKIPYDGNKVLIVGGFVYEENQPALNLILMDPETQKFQVIPSTGDAEACCYSGMTACYWKDSKIIVFGGYHPYEFWNSSAVAIITLKDLDSDNPSADWEKIETPTKLYRSLHLAHIYENKMYVLGGSSNDEEEESQSEVWCLDLIGFTWSKCDFPRRGYPLEFTLFSKNKAYVLLQTHIVRKNTEIRELNFETMSSRTFTIPEIQPEPTVFRACPQVIDGKMYFFERFPGRSNETSTNRQLWAYDLDSESWTEMKAESPSDLGEIGRMICCNNHLVLEETKKNGNQLFGEFWSLSLNPPKPSKYSATSTTVNKVQQTMKEFFFEAPYSDISFEVESQIIPAHKWLLSQKNIFSANLLSSEMSSSKIIINDLKATTLRALLEYLYSDHVEIDDTIALELLQQANKYFISGELKAACEKHLIQSIESENYVALGKLAELVGAASLRDAVVAFIARNMKKIKPRKDFNEISNSLLRDSIVKFIAK